jgi:hypothetical protein
MTSTTNHNARPCPVAELAAEAAAAIRLHRALRSDPDAMMTTGDAPSAEQMVDTLLERIEALATLAAQRQARSPTGALYQVLVAINEAEEALSEVSPECRGSQELRPARFAQRRIARLLYSAIYQAGEDELGDDLRTLRDWYAPGDFHETDEIGRLLIETRIIGKNPD